MADQHDRVVLITGASKGIGAVTAELLARSFAVVLLHYNSDAAGADAVAARVRALGAAAHTVRADLSTEAGCASLVAEVRRLADGRLDVLVNNAGAMLKREPLRAGPLDWELAHRTFAVNVFSAMSVTTLCLPMLERGRNPCVVNLTSVAARTGAPSATVYGAAKGALDSWTRGAAKELAPTVRVNAVAPGVIDTPFHAGVTTGEQMEAFRAGTPLKKVGRAEDIAAAIKFCIDSTFMTGETIDVNGGSYMR
eukprot:m51a1_g5890 hypothetical protein (252) ;mRNA; f:524977-525915